jgi:hypothetical protein
METRSKAVMAVAGAIQEGGGRAEWACSAVASACQVVAVLIVEAKQL